MKRKNILKYFNLIISNHLSLTTSKLIKRTEDYQMQLAEWEKHLQEITYKLAKLEEENKCIDMRYP